MNISEIVADSVPETERLPGKIIHSLSELQNLE